MIRISSGTISSLAGLFKTNDSAYLVGGFLRDALLGIDSKDIDLVVVGDVLKSAEKITKKLGGNYFYLEEKQQLIRVQVPAPEGQYSIDLAPLPDSIYGDLGKRDFTINAIAADLGTMDNGRRVSLVDPFHGREDLKNRVLRSVSADSLPDDPVRSLRAIRFARRFALRIDDITAKQIVEAAPGLVDAAGERVFDELSELTPDNGFAESLELMRELNMLRYILPECEDMVGVPQNDFHHLDVWGHTLESIRELEALVDGLDNIWPQHAGWIRESLAQTVQGRCRKLGFLKIALLLHDIGKPKAMISGEDEIIHFYGHAEIGALMTRAIGKRLRLAKKVRQLLELAVSEHMRLGFYAKDDLLSEKSMDRLYKHLGGSIPDLVLVSYADRQAARGPRSTAKILTKHMEYLHILLDRFVEYRDAPKIRPLLRGKDLIESLGMIPGPRFRRILEEVEAARQEKLIATRDQALELARQVDRSLDKEDKNQH